jgi:diguanylate cyclase (GGDEF)-like protein
VRSDGAARAWAAADSDCGRSDDPHTLCARDQTPRGRAHPVPNDGRPYGQLPGCAMAFHAGGAAVAAAPANGRRTVTHFRDERSSRDHAAQERDELAAARDLDADYDDQTAHALDEVEGLLDSGTPGVPETRERDLARRQRAALDRERARRDRHLAAVDRELAARDREQARRDRELAGTDELTGARRRGVGLQDLQREIDRARRTGERLAAAYVDVDGLKAVNDQHGHRAGDTLLRDIVQRLRRDMRPYDLLVRLGGDEFLCVMPGVSAEQARRRFAHVGSGLPAGPTARSVCFGLSELRNGDVAMGLVDRADQDLIARRGAR